MNSQPFPFFDDMNEWHLRLQTGLATRHEDFHIFRYEDVMTNLVNETPYYKDAFFHVTFATSMDATLTVNDKRFDCRQGGLFFFIAPEQLIHWKRGDEQWKGFVMLIKPRFITYSIQGSQLLKDLMLFEREGINVLQVSKENEPGFADLFEKILFEYYNDQPLKFEIIRAYLKIIFIQAQRISLSGALVKASKTSSDIVYNFQALVNKFFHQKKALYEYAQALHVDEKYLQQVIKKETGKTPTAFIKDRILLEAKCLLLHTDLDVSSIAFELNFDEPSNFMRFFKGREKLTPSAYRKAAGKI
ncbi:MAG TPA: helix-turn-helix domain-containing protein [Chitinophagaceae bacterium]|nr:helix-turn-helix domain-containing protein [Chitinophagaceae bacterium]